MKKLYSALSFMLIATLACTVDLGGTTPPSGPSTRIVITATSAPATAAVQTVTAVVTATPAFITFTPAPLTNTLVPAAANTSVPSTRTNTPVSSTATHTLVPPTNTRAPSTATHTSVPPTHTPTAILLTKLEKTSWQVDFTFGGGSHRLQPSFTQTGAVLSGSNRDNNAEVNIVTTGTVTGNIAVIKFTLSNGGSPRGEVTCTGVIAGAPQTISGTFTAPATLGVGATSGNCTFR